MSRHTVFQIIYGSLGLFGAYLLLTRVLAGDWLWTPIPLAVVALCVYRLLTMDDNT